MTIKTPMKLNGEVTPTGRSREYIEKLASEIAEKIKLKPGAPLKKVVASLGGKIEIPAWDSSDQSGSIDVRGPGDFTIYLSPFTGLYRDRFTIAHELGHYFLHSLLGKKKLQIAREGSNQAEWEANWFAAGLLMPEDEFRKQWEKTQGNADALANVFELSPQSIRVRAKTLGLV